MNWWSPVTSANWLTRSCSIVTHCPRPVSWPIRALSSSTERTTFWSGMDELLLPDRLLGEPQLEDALPVVIRVAPERLVVLGALEEEVQVELPGEADAAV